MGKKKKVVARPEREPSRHQLARWEKEKRRNRILLGVGIFIVAAVLIVVGVGWFNEQYRPLHQTVIRVNNSRFNMDYYIKSLEYYGRMSQSTLNIGSAGEIAHIISRQELMRQGARALGIGVSDEMVDKELKNRQMPSRYRDFVQAELLISELREKYFENQVPQAAEQRHLQAMLLESQTQTLEVKQRIEASENFTALAKELSLENVSREKGGDFGWLPQGILELMVGSTVIEEPAWALKAGEMSSPIYDAEISKSVGYWLIKVLERKPETNEAHVQALLLGNRLEAETARARIEAGEDIDAVAKEVSRLESAQQGGADIGWVTRDIAGKVFGDYAFDTSVPLNTLSQPIRDEALRTKGGYWLVRVVDQQADRTIDKDTRELLKSRAFTEWLTGLEQSQETTIELLLDESQMLWALGVAQKNIAVIPR